MIETLYGRIYDISTADCRVIIECGGVGYAVTVTANTAAQLPKPAFSPDGTALQGPAVRIYTHMAVREDAVELFGFYSRDELAMFRLLISVSGIGPKAAMSILSLLTPHKLAGCVAAGDAKMIARAPGVGPKTAARVVLELKDKIAKAFPQLVSASDDTEETVVIQPRSTNMEDARDALTALGYSRSEIAASMKNIDPNAEVEDIIRQALATLMKN